jgi:hypothetical protein
MLVPWTTLRKGIKEEVYYFKKGDNLKKVPKFGSSPSMMRIVPSVNYNAGSKKAWSGYAQKDNFAVRWSGFLLCPKWGASLLVSLYFFKVTSDDGSNLYIDNKKIVNNDGLHGKRAKFGKAKLVKGQHNIRLEYFEKGGGAAMELQWRAKGVKGAAAGESTFVARWLFGNKWKTITSKHLRYQIKKGFREEVFYVAAKDRLPDLNKVRAANQRAVKAVNYPNTKKKWPRFTRADNFAVRWSGTLKMTNPGTYKFSLSSDDGSRMFLNGKLTINNDGLHAWRQAQTTVTFGSSRGNFIIVEYFQKSGHAGCSLRYMGPDTKNKMEHVGADGAVHVRYIGVKTPPLPKKKAANKAKPKGKK